MQELEKILEEIENESERYRRAVGTEQLLSGLEIAEDIIRKYLSRENTQEITRSSRDNAGWIPVERGLPEEPKENPVFDDKALELYLVDTGGNYPLRAFWNGKQFTDGWSVLNVIAWRPLPEPYQPEQTKESEAR